MGDSGGGFLQILDPIGYVAKKTGADWMHWIDPMSSITKQSLQNTLNVFEGKESFGAHENWFGTGPVGDALNPIMGGRTDAQRAKEADNDKLWTQYYTNMVDTAPKKEPKTLVTGYKPKPAPKGGTTGTSLLSDEET